jgi:hypothetical protein
MRNEFINDGAWAGTSECFDCWPNAASVLRNLTRGTKESHVNYR